MYKTIQRGQGGGGARIKKIKLTTSTYMYIDMIHGYVKLGSKKGYVGRFRSAIKLIMCNFIYSYLNSFQRGAGVSIIMIQRPQEVI